MSHHTLIVGDGNFSFSLSYCQKYPDKQIIATSYQDKKTLEEQYETVNETICKLEREKNVQLYYNIDATSLESYDELKDHCFQCIVFNFPHSGGKSNIKKNMELVQGFLSSAVNILDPVVGEIWVTLCKGQGGTPMDVESCQRGYENSWKIVELAAESELILTLVKPFVAQEWPGYTPTGYRGNNKGFNTDGALTHVFTKERIITKRWQPSLITVTTTPSPFSATPNTIPVNLCKCCCHGNNDATPILALQPSDLKCYESFEFPLLEQHWHPLSIVNKDLMKLFCDSFSSLDIILHCSTPSPSPSLSPPSPSSSLPSSSSLSSVPVIHRTTANNDNTQRRTIQLFSSDDSELLLQEGEEEYVMESSLKDRIPLLLDQLRGSIRTSSAVLLSSAVYPKVTAISTSPYKEQPISHQLMCLLYGHNTTSTIDSTTSALNATIITGIIGQYLHDSIVKESDLIWSSDEDSTDTTKYLMLRKEGTDNIPMAQLSYVTLTSSSHCISVESPLDIPSSVVQPLQTPAILTLETPHTALPSALLPEETTAVHYVIVYLDNVMALKYAMTDVRAMWSKDIRFYQQFTDNHQQDSSPNNSSTSLYRPFSLFPPHYTHDVSFWVNNDECSSFNSLQNYVTLKLIPLIRSIAGLNVVSVQCIDVYTLLHTGQTSFCYRLVYSSHDRGLGRRRVLYLQEKIRCSIEEKLKWKLR